MDKEKDKETEELKENTKERSKLLSPKLDIVFQALFGEVGSEKITKRFLEAILRKKNRRNRFK